MKNLRSTASLILALIMLMQATSFTTFAAESQETEEFTYCIVTDMAGLLSETDVTEIEQAVAESGSQFHLALYIENKDKSEISQKYVNQLSETMYAEIFGTRRDGIMIVFSFYAEANGYYAVHFGPNASAIASESKVKNIIEGSYHDYPTDSSWVSGSFKSCVSYFAEVKAKTENTENTNVLIIIGCFVITVVVFMCIYGLYNSAKEKNEEIAKLTEDLKAKKQELKSSNQELAAAKKNAKAIGTLYAREVQWHADALKVMSDLQERIDDLNAQEKAQAFNQKCNTLRLKKASIENFAVFNEFAEEYDKLSDNEKQYITSNIEEVLAKRNESAKAYAEEASKKIQSTCKSTADRHHKGLYDNTMQYYNHLPLYIKLMLAKSVVETLKRNQSKAETDEKAYKRRQQESYHRTSSSHSGSTFGNSFHGSSGSTFGGHFGGGH